MTPSRSADLARLRAANPERIDAARAGGAAAQAVLARILGEPVGDAARGGRFRRRFGRSSRRLIVALAVVAVGGGAAFAATDPPGWWSSNPTQARYGSNPAVHASAPAARAIGCARSGAGLRCAPGRSGQRYLRIDTVRAPRTGLTRRRALALIASAQAHGRLTAAAAARLRADVAAVPDGFFATLELASRYATYSAGNTDGMGRTLVPPRGVPQFLACERVRTGIACQNLNGDEHVAVGAGIYAASPAAGWRAVRLPAERYGGLPPGISFTPAAYRLLIDLGRFAASSRSRPAGPRAARQAVRRPTARGSLSSGARTPAAAPRP